MQEVLQRQIKMRREKGYAPRVGHMLIGEDLITERQLAIALAVQFDLVSFDLAGPELNFALLTRISLPKFQEHCFVPIGMEEGRMQVAVDDPPSETIQGFLEQQFHCPVEFVMVSAGQLSKVRDYCEQLIKRGPSENLTRTIFEADFFEEDGGGPGSFRILGPRKAAAIEEEEAGEEELGDMVDGALETIEAPSLEDFVALDPLDALRPASAGGGGSASAPRAGSRSTPAPVVDAFGDDDSGGLAFGPDSSGDSGDALDGLDLRAMGSGEPDALDAMNAPDALDALKPPAKPVPPAPAPAPPAPPKPAPKPTISAAALRGSLRPSQPLEEVVEEEPPEGAISLTPVDGEDPLAALLKATGAKVAKQPPKKSNPMVPMVPKASSSPGISGPAVAGGPPAKPIPPPPPPKPSPSGLSYSEQKKLAAETAKAAEAAAKAGAATPEAAAFAPAVARPPTSPGKAVVMTAAVVEELVVPPVTLRRSAEHTTPPLSRVNQIIPPPLASLFAELMRVECHALSLVPHRTDVDLVAAHEDSSRVLRSLPLGEYQAVLEAVQQLLGLAADETSAPLRRKVEIEFEGQPATIRVWILPSSPPTLSFSAVDRESWSSRRQIHLAPDLLDAVARRGAQRRGLVVLTTPDGTDRDDALAGILAHLKRRQLRIALFTQPSSHRLREITYFEMEGQDSLFSQEQLLFVAESGIDVLAFNLPLKPERLQELLPLAAVEATILVCLQEKDAVDAIRLLASMPLAPPIIASTLEMVVAVHRSQRLCFFCRRPQILEDSQLPDALKGSKLSGAVVFSSPGCPLCQGTGHRGMVHLYETLVWDHDKASAEMFSLDRRSLMKKCYELGLMRPISMEARSALLQGIVSFDEYLRMLNLSGRAAKGK